MLKYYFKLLNKHKEVFGTEEPCSFNELLYTVEAPEHISGVDIMKYAEFCSLEDFPRYIASSEFKLSESELEVYPFHELLFCMLRGDFCSPLIFLKVEDGFKCIEGKHRIRLISLCYETNIELPNFPVIRVEHVETRNMPRYPKNYSVWLDYMKKHSVREKAYLTKRAIKGIMK